MSYEEKSTVAYLLAVAGAYATYLAIIANRLQGSSVAEVSYAWVLLWTTLGSTIASTFLRTLLETARPSETRRRDVRDKEIYRFGEYVSRWFVVGGATAAFALAVAKADYFWIANVIYFGFVMWAIAGSAVKLVAYRRGF